MPSKTKITFFDIPTRKSVPTSPNTWKVRLVLNFKELEYETRWVLTSDIENTCKSLNIPPTGTKPNGEPHYTLPALIDYTQSSSEPVILSDSTPIIRYLEHTYPSPSALFPSGSETNYTELENFIMGSVIKYMPSLWLIDLYNAKPSKDQNDFRRRIEQRLGKKLEEIELHGAERDEAWKQVQQTFDKVATYFPNRQGGKYLTGEQISFPDFTVCGVLAFLKNASPSGWKKVGEWEQGKWHQYYQGFAPWMGVDNHPDPSTL